MELLTASPAPAPGALYRSPIMEILIQSIDHTLIYLLNVQVCVIQEKVYSLDSLHSKLKVQ